ncbi:MAG: efflux RND transporter periplasmic adaptor subunit [Bryobacterales bacterium]|nr:efflux RND transporter periplasmic adaptor subunit [Bryobacterales bacterium]
MKKLIAIVALAGVAGALAWWLMQPAAPRTVPFAKATRQLLVSTIVTNGKVEPEQFAAVRAPRGGAVRRVLVRRGDQVVAGSALVELDSSTEKAELVSAESRLAQARAELRRLEEGGSRTARAELQGALESARMQLENSRRERERTGRLVEKNAETREALRAAEDRVQQWESEVQSIENRQKALMVEGNREAAEARVAEAEAAIALIRQRMAQSKVPTPVGGVVYSLAAKAGGFLQPGDLIAEVGQTRTLRVLVYVDEPELGKVGRGMPVEIQWDARPGEKWLGKVEILPTQIVALNTRQVGEVVCLIDNEKGLLPPGANVNAEIRSAVVENALAIPKAALRRGEKGSGVLVLAGNKVEFRAVELGITSITHAEVRSGLKEGDAVALPADGNLEPGERVIPQLP